MVPGCCLGMITFFCFIVVAVVFFEINFYPERYRLVKSFHGILFMRYFRGIIRSFVDEGPQETRSRYGSGGRYPAENYLDSRFYYVDHRGLTAHANLTQVSLPKRGHYKFFPPPGCYVFFFFTKVNP